MAKCEICKENEGKETIMFPYKIWIEKGRGKLKLMNICERCKRDMKLLKELED